MGDGVDRETDDCESRRTSGGVGGEWECRGETEELDRDELNPSFDVQLDTEDVEGRERLGRFGRVKVV